VRIDSENSSDGANSNKIENSASNLSPWGKRQFQVVSNLKFLNYFKINSTTVEGNQHCFLFTFFHFSTLEMLTQPKIDKHLKS